MITVSEKALQHVIELMMESGVTPDSHHLRVGVKGGGCSGLSYAMDFDDKIEPTDETVEIDGGLKVIIAGAGGAAHLPGMVASITSLPVIGVPIKSSNSVDGWDSILSILQMPAGVPVATVALNGAKNAGILAAQMIGNHDAAVSKAVEAYKNALRNNPNDEETRYNFALAKKMLKNNPPKKDDKKDKKDKKKDNKKDDKKDKKDDKKDDKKKDDKKDGDQKNKNDQKNNQDGQPKPKPGGIQKERVQNLLDAVNNEEKKIQDKVNANKVKGKPIQTEKDW